MHEYSDRTRSGGRSDQQRWKRLNTFEVKDPEGHTISFVKATEAFFRRAMHRSVRGFCMRDLS
jgi:hypothetical protein